MSSSSRCGTQFGNYEIGDYSEKAEWAPCTKPTTPSKVALSH